MMSSRQSNPPPSGIAMYQTVQNNEPQLFVPGQMRGHMARKAPVTQHQQHRANSHGSQQQN